MSNNLDETKSEKTSQKKFQPCASNLSITLLNTSLDKELCLEENNVWTNI